MTFSINLRVQSTVIMGQYTYTLCSFSMSAQSSTSYQNFPEFKLFLVGLGKIEWCPATTWTATNGATEISVDDWI